MAILSAYILSHEHLLLVLGTQVLLIQVVMHHNIIDVAMHSVMHPSPSPS